jgi:plasmid stabilization system protein ParE
VKIRWIAAARQDRADIVDYIAAENPRAALKMDELFSEAAAKLGDFPMLGRIGKIPAHVNSSRMKATGSSTKWTRQQTRYG